MKVTPKTDDELNPLLFPGEYDAEVIKAEEKISAKGNDMIAIVLRVFHDGSVPVLVNDYLLDSVPDKLKRFCESAGLINEYEAGELDADGCKGASVRVKLKIDKDKTGDFPDKNAVAGYVAKRKLPLNPEAKGTGHTGAKVAAMNAAAEADDVPF